MRGWSINLFRIRGIQISLHFSFLLLLAYACDEGWKEGGLPGLYWSGGTVVALFCCIVLHELGHSLTGMSMGFRVRRILLSLFGGVAEFDNIPRSPAKEILIVVAGPAVNFVIAGILWVVLKVGANSVLFTTTPWGEFLSTLATWNIWVALFNMIPAYPMDGGRIVRAALALKMPYLKASYTALIIAKVVTIAGAIIALYLGYTYMALVFGYIFMIGHAEYKALKRLESQDALWRASLIKNVSVPPVTEPPVL
jgi:Zn-dependent protease